MLLLCKKRKITVVYTQIMFLQMYLHVNMYFLKVHTLHRYLALYKHKGTSHVWKSCMIFFFLYMKAKKVHISALYLSIREDFDKAIVSSIILYFFSNNRTSKEDFCTIKLNKIERLLFYWIELSKSIATKELPLLFMQLLGNVSHFYFPFSFLIEEKK